MKLSAILEDDENVVMIPLYWLNNVERQKLMRDGYQIIPIPGYKEAEGFRAVKIIGPYTNKIWQIAKYSIPIWEDWKLTAQYASRVDRISNTGIQMFDHLDDDEKILALKYTWYSTIIEYIIKYFREHPGLLERAKRMDDFPASSFKELF